MVKLSLIAAAAFGLFIGSAVAAPHKLVSKKKIVPTYNQWVNQKSAPISGNIKYNGGPLLVNQVNVYHIYYGNWTSDGKKILENFSQHVTNTPYFNIEKTYYQQLNGGPKEYVAGPIVYQGSIDDNYSAGKQLSDKDVVSVVTNHLTSGELPTDKDAIYFLLTSSDVSETSGFCSQYCGYHLNFPLKSGVDIKYSFVGDVTRCLDGCAPDNTKVSPNGNPGVDGMVSVLAHEMMEAISDPDPSSGWTDASGNENADKCAYVYGTEHSLTNGAKWNVQIGSLKYLIQQNWNAEVQGCQLGTGTVASTLASTVPLTTTTLATSSVSTTPLTTTTSDTPSESTSATPSDSTSDTPITFTLTATTPITTNTSIP